MGATPHDPHDPVNLRWLNRRLLIVVACLSIICTLLAAIPVTLYIVTQANDANRVDAIESCDGQNLLRGFARLATHRYQPTVPSNKDLADWLLRIRDCPATYDRGRIVTVTPQVERQYLTLLAQHHRVAVRDSGSRFVPMP